MNTFICPNCGTPSGYAVKAPKGNVLIGIILLLFFIVPGIIYFIWMGSGGTDVCIKCKQPGLVPISSPRGQQLADQYRVKIEPEVIAPPVRSAEVSKGSVMTAWAVLGLVVVVATALVLFGGDKHGMGSFYPSSDRAAATDRARILGEHLQTIDRTQKH